MNNNKVLIKGKIRLLRDFNSGKSRGIAFFECKNKENYEKCLNLDKLTYEGRKLKFG